MISGNNVYRKSDVRHRKRCLGQHQTSTLNTIASLHQLVLLYVMKIFIHQSCVIVN